MVQVVGIDVFVPTRMSFLMSGLGTAASTASTSKLKPRDCFATDEDWELYQGKGRQAGSDEGRRLKAMTYSLVTLLAATAVG